MMKVSNLNPSGGLSWTFSEEKSLKANIVEALERMGLGGLFEVIQKRSILTVCLTGKKPSGKTIFFDCNVKVGQDYCYPNSQRMYFPKVDSGQSEDDISFKLLPGTVTLRAIEKSVKAELLRIKTVLVDKNIEETPQNVFIALFKWGSSDKFDEFVDYFGHGLTGAQIILFSENRIPLDLIDSYKGLPKKWILQINGGGN